MTYGNPGLLVLYTYIQILRTLLGTLRLTDRDQCYIGIVTIFADFDLFSAKQMATFLKPMIRSTFGTKWEYFK
jgi:hypothetical protein